LLAAWQEFLRGKRHRQDVQKFSLNLMDNIFSLHQDLLYQTYEHGGYETFKINDPKPRDIHKATVRDRLLHHAVYRILYPFFDRTFIADSYSCRLNKGTHKAINRFRKFAYKTSKNNTKTCWILKGDIRKFFANIDHEILLRILREYIPDEKIIWLLEKIINSFSSTTKGVGLPCVALAKKGLPLGNLTSQLFVNIYMNRFDQFVKHRLLCHFRPEIGINSSGNPELLCFVLSDYFRLEQPTPPQSTEAPLQGGESNHFPQEENCYIRYADDFVIFSENKKWLEDFIPAIKDFFA
jgi:retron-type reverse transcriptase